MSVLAKLLVHPASHQHAIKLDVIQDPKLKDTLLSKDALLGSDRGKGDNGSCCGGSRGLAQELDFSGWRADSLREEIRLRQKNTEDQQRKASVVVTIQRYVRGWLKRRKYLRHRDQLRSLLRRLMLKHQTNATLLLQRMVRGMFARRQRRAMLAELQRVRDEEQDQDKKKKAKGKKKLDDSSLSHVQLLVKDGELFIKGFTAYWAFRYDEGISALDKFLKKFPEDKIAERLLERCRCGKVAVAEEVKRAKAQAKEAAVSGKRAARGLPKPTTPSLEPTTGKGMTPTKKKPSSKGSRPSSSTSILGGVASTSADPPSAAAVVGGRAKPGRRPSSAAKRLSKKSTSAETIAVAATAAVAAALPLATLPLSASSASPSLPIGSSRGKQAAAEGGGGSTAAKAATAVVNLLPSLQPSSLGKRTSTTPELPPIVPSRADIKKKSMEVQRQTAAAQ